MAGAARARATGTRAAAKAARMTRRRMAAFPHSVRFRPLHTVLYPSIHGEALGRPHTDGCSYVSPGAGSELVRGRLLQVAAAQVAAERGGGQRRAGRVLHQLGE